MGSQGPEQGPEERRLRALWGVIDGGHVFDLALKGNLGVLADGVDGGFDTAVSMVMMAKDAVESDSQGQHSDPATLQTRTKRKQCPIATLFAHDRIDSGLYRAAQEIEAAYRLISDDVKIPQFRYREQVGVMQLPYDDEPLSEILVQQRYMHWSDAMQAKNQPLAMVLDIIVDGKSFVWSDRHYKQRKGNAARLTVKALNLYSTVKRRLNAQRAG